MEICRGDRNISIERYLKPSKSVWQNNTWVHSTNAWQWQSVIIEALNTFILNCRILYAKPHLTYLNSEQPLTVILEQNFCPMLVSSLMRFGFDHSFTHRNDQFANAWICPFGWDATVAKRVSSSQHQWHQTTDGEWHVSMFLGHSGFCFCLLQSESLKFGRNQS